MPRPSWPLRRWWRHTWRPKVWQVPIQKQSQNLSGSSNRSDAPWDQESATFCQRRRPFLYAEMEEKVSISTYYFYYLLIMYSIRVLIKEVTCQKILPLFHGKSFSLIYLVVWMLHYYICIPTKDVWTSYYFVSGS